MDQDMVSAAEKALAGGIRIDDGRDDFVIMGSNKEEVNENNPSPYRLPFLDVKSLSVGSDEKYFYYKATFFDKIPDQPADVNGDKIIDNGLKIGLMNKNGNEQALLFTNYGYILNISSADTYYFTGPTGIEEPEEARFSEKDSDSKVYGGPGNDYIMGAFPLDKLGLGPGQETYFSFSMEAGSEKYSHAAVDVLRGHGKHPAHITWKLGLSEYQIEENTGN